MTEKFDIEKVKFDEKGLVPCIVQDYETKRVLTLAYMNRESMKITLEKGADMLLLKITAKALAEG